MEPLKLTHLDLCTGIGGFHLAAEWAGFETIGFAEIEPYCCKLLTQKWPEIKNYGDLRRADFSGLRGRVDVLSAGVPCQPASLAGKRRGDADDRWLWPAVLDVVELVKPAWCIFENPPGILTLDEFSGVLLRLESLGYALRAFSVPANAVGAKHRRQRVFIVTYRNGQRLEGTEHVRQWNGINKQSFDLGREALADAEHGSEPEWSRQTWRQSKQWTPERMRPRGSSGPYGFRLTQPPLCRRVDGIRDRSHRLKALGNAVVPQQAFPFFEAIAEILKLENGAAKV